MLKMKKFGTKERGHIEQLIMQYMGDEYHDIKLVKLFDKIRQREKELEQRVIEFEVDNKKLNKTNNKLRESIYNCSEIHPNFEY